MEKFSNLTFSLKSINALENDFTLSKVTFIIMDANVSGNRQVVSKDLLLSASATLLNKPIAAKYYGVVDGGDDHLGTHEEYIGINRYGKKKLTSDTITIGHFTTPGYFADYEGTEVLMADGVLHKEKNPDIVDLLQEWIDKGIQINSSVEYYYSNYEMIDGIENIKAPLIFAQHVILNSENRGDYPVVDGAYSNSQLLSMNMKLEWNQSLNKINESDGEAMNEIMEKVVNELSVGDLKWKLYNALATFMSAAEYNNVWLSAYNTYPDHFIYEYWNGEKYDFFDVAYSVNENDEVTIDFEGRTKVELVTDWQAVSNTLATVEAELESKNAEIIAKDGEIETLTQSVNELTVVKTELEISLNSKDVEIETISEKVKSLNEIAEKYEAEQAEIKLANSLNFYKEKFSSLNALEKFESEEVQGLIKESLNSVEAENKLDKMVVELVVLPKSTNSISGSVLDATSKNMGKLIPESKKSANSKYFSN